MGALPRDHRGDNAIVAEAAAEAEERVTEVYNMRFTRFESLGPIVGDSNTVWALWQ